MLLEGLGDLFEDVRVGLMQLRSCVLIPDELGCACGVVRHLPDGKAPVDCILLKGLDDVDEPADYQQ